MKIIEPKVELIKPEGYDLNSIYKMIEIGGRTCYKSDDKITEDSAKKFVEMIKTNNHLSVFEHGTVYLKLEYFNPVIDYDYIMAVEIALKYKKNKYSKVLEYKHNPTTESYYITTNMRVIVENGWEEDLQYLCEPTEYHEKRYTLRFTTQIAITRESNRHRVNSISEQSTRYCNYSKDKFDNQISINLPTWIDKNDAEVQANFIDYCESVATRENDDWDAIDYWLFANMACEYSYMNLIRLGWKPQQARVVLPLDTNTEVVYTAFESDWKHFIELRTSQAAHPDIRILAEEVKRVLITK